ncbi:hypothetical protein ERJ70_12065 [Sediminibacillus dalangtanensis]|uniref:SPOR domain-containing protein n=1 Tax=Sediminibacillus dalangtanensis TaxID=2729421 RepID=A0ABX7VTH3_9BACI|nr:SPOR domain-containing protein [Sediminibacillus dalangtanensis]QTM99961.1 hypothetical protein ERJ70_12065 [Sediminibacillus dalangtanensis]
MDKHKPITVRINDNKRKHVNAKHHEYPEESKKTINEQAAALEKHLHGSASPLFESPIEEGTGTSDWYQKKTPGKRKLPGIYKVFLFAAFAALAIGLALGFIMLRMFAGIDEASDPETLPSSYTNPANDDPGKETAEKTNGLKGMEAFVIQGGVFSSKDKAEAWQKNFTEADFPSMVWEREGQYYLFAGVADTEAAAKKTASAMTENKLETYVKPWQTTATEKDLTEGEAEWLQQFPPLWQDSVSAGGEINREEWNDWLGLLPKDAAEALVQLHDQAEKLTNEANALSPGEVQIELLSLWNKAVQL